MTGDARSAPAPAAPRGRALQGLVLAALTSLTTCALGVFVLAEYSWPIFVVQPFLLGWLAVRVGGRPEWSPGRVLVQSLLAVLAAAVLLAAVAFEGLVCLALALPLALPIAFLGGFVARSMARQAAASERLRSELMMAVALLPLAFGASHALDETPTTFSVTTSVIMRASPSDAWPHVVAHGDITSEPALPFRLGVATPLRTTIDGTGVGAERRCVYTTGDFVEPVEIWEVNRHLAFRVTSCPPPMKELTLWPGKAPPHLHGYLVAERGEFRLMELGDGRTLLSGTTWYRHGLGPEGYWRFWSDALIRAVHRRVLDHVAALAERDAALLERR